MGDKDTAAEGGSTDQSGNRGERLGGKGSHYDNTDLLTELGTHKTAERKKADAGGADNDDEDTELELETDAEEEDEAVVSDEDDDEEAKKAVEAEKKKDATDEDEEDDDDEEDVELDADTKKRLASVQRAEKRAKEQLAAEQAKLDQRVKEWEPRIVAAQKFEELQKRAKYAPDAVLEALGLTTDDFEAAARTLYARSQAGAKDPKNREAAARLQREREAADQNAVMRKELDDLKKQISDRDLQAQQQVAIDEYADTITKAAKSEKVEAPLVKQMLAKTPNKARRRMLEVAAELAAEFGEVATAADVITELEKKRRKELEEDGIDPAKVLGIASTDEEGGKKRKATRTLGKAGGGSQTSQAGEKKKSRDEEFEDLKAELRSAKLKAK